MKRLFITSTKETPQHGEYHYIDLKGGKRLFCAEDDRHIPESFEALPHLIDPSPIDAAHAKALTHIGATTSHTALGVLKLAHAIHPLFKP